MRHYSIMPEAENDDGSPTGQFFLMPVVHIGTCPLTGEPEYEPDDWAEALGPMSLIEARKTLEAADVLNDEN